MNTIKSFLCVGLLLAAATVRPATGQTEEMHVGGTLYVEAVQELVDELHRSLFEGDIEAFSSLVDRHTMMRRMAEFRPAMIMQVDDVVTGLEQGLFQMASNVTAALKTGAAYNLLNIQERKGGVELLYRMILPDGTLNYHAYLLSPDGTSARVADIYLYMSASWLSEMLAELISYSENGLEGRPGLTLVNHRLASGDMEAARAAFESLDVRLQKSRLGTFMALQMASNEDGDAYAAALDTLEARYPGDPALSLLLSDHFVGVGEYDRAHLALNRIDAHVGGDPYIDAMRANLALDEGQSAQAISYAQRAIDEEPTLLLPYWTLMAVFLDHEEHERVAGLLRFIVDDLGVPLDLDRLETEQQFAAFVESEAFVTLMADRR
jgi:tetratricopeptide (TPR) repeat protein